MFVDVRKVHSCEALGGRLGVDGLHGSQLQTKPIAKFLGQLWDHMALNVLFALVLLLHQSKNIRKHVRL